MTLLIIYIPVSFICRVWDVVIINFVQSRFCLESMSEVACNVVITMDLYDTFSVLVGIIQGLKMEVYIKECCLYIGVK